MPTARTHTFYDIAQQITVSRDATFAVGGWLVSTNVKSGVLVEDGKTNVSCERVSVERLLQHGSKHPAVCSGCAMEENDATAKNRDE